MRRIVSSLSDKAKAANAPAPPVIDTTKTTEPLVDRLAEQSAALTVITLDSNQTTKLSAIRAVLLEKPNARACEIIAELEKKGINVSKQLVYQVRNQPQKKEEEQPPVLKLHHGDKRPIIRDEILADKTAGRRKIIRKLRGRGINVSEEYIRLVRNELKAEGHVFPVYSKRGERKPIKANAIRAEITDSPAATDEEIVEKLARRDIKTVHTTVHNVRSKMRKEGTYIDVPAKPKPYPELNEEQRTRISDSIANAESYAKYRWFRHLKGIGSPDDFADFVLGRLPFIVAAYEPFRPPEERKSWKHFLRVGIMFCEKIYRAQVLSIALGVPHYKIDLLMGILGDLNKGMTLEDAAEKRKITVEKAQELIGLYNEYRRINGATTLDSIHENREEFKTGAYSFDYGQEEGL